MSLDNLNRNAEYRRDKERAAFGCYFFVQGANRKGSDSTIRGSIAEFIRLFDVDEELTPMEWLLSEYYRYQKRDLHGEGLKYKIDENSSVS